jgi:hypothetical protein
MATLIETAPAFVEMAHRIVWCAVATVDRKQRPRSRILHPIWEWDGRTLTGWIATGPTPTKRSNLETSPYASLNYWCPEQDTCVAECKVTWAFDDATRTRVWDLFVNGPAPVGYDPRMIPGWTKPTDPSFAVLKLEPWRLRVFPGSVLMGQGGTVLTWQAG